MSTGRTTWWACDAAEHDRELVVELGLEHGPAGPYTLRVLKDLAQQQRHDGTVRTGWHSLSRKVFAPTDEVRAIVNHAAGIGALDDLVIDPDGRRFTVRVSGWEADQKTGKEAIKKASQRARDKDEAVPEKGDNDPSCPREGDDVPECPLTRPDQTSTTETSSPVELARLDDARTRLRSEQVTTVFDAWVAATDRDPARTKLTPDRRRRIEKALNSHGLDDCLAAVRNIGADAWAGGANDRGKPFNDIEHALGSGERLERWRDATPRTGSAPVGASSSVSRGDALIAKALTGGTA